MKKNVSAYLTVYLALTLGILVTLSLALIEGVRLSTLQLEANCIADIGMDSMMAEYHRELFRRFNLLALDTSYGTKTVGSKNAVARLEYYLGKNVQSRVGESLGGVAEFAYKDFLRLGLEDAELTEICILTDGNGQVFRKKAVEAVQDDVGISLIQNTLQWMRTVKEYELDTRDVEAEKREADEKIASYQGHKVQVSEEEWETVEIENPTDILEERKKTGVVNLVLGEEAELSAKMLNSGGLVYRRMQEGKINRGNCPLEEPEPLQGIAERLWFQEYLIRYLGCYTDRKPDAALDYELEYLIVGKDADADNLKGVINRLTAMREAANAAYLFSDKEKYSEADLIALGISLLIFLPELQVPLRTAILFGWAFAESVYDMKVIMKGGRIPLIKDRDSWHYGLESIFKNLWGRETEVQESKGLSYEDYLRILLLLTDLDELTGRAMDMVEADIRLTPGNEAFRMDGCYAEVKGRITFTSGYGYRQAITVEKKY